HHARQYEMARRSQRSLKPREMAIRQPETKVSSEWSLLFGVIGSGLRKRDGLALGAPAAPGGDIGRGRLHRRKHAQPGANGAAFRALPASAGNKASAACAKMAARRLHLGHTSATGRSIF